MAYTIDPVNGDIVIGGFQNGIGDSPYSGFTDMRGVNPTSIPGEASVSFSGNQEYQAPSLTSITATTSSATDEISFPTTTPLEAGQAIYITNAGTSGLSTSQVYWISKSFYSGGVNSFTVTTVYGDTTGIQVLANGTIIFSTFTLTLGLRGQISKNYMVESQDGFHWIADSNGFVWTDKVTTSGGTGITSTSSWTYTGNRGSIGPNADPAAFGNGLVYFQPVHPVNQNFDGYLFLFRQQQIDYLKVFSAGSSVAAGSLAWVNDWSQYWPGGSRELTLALLWGELVAYPHEAIQTPDGRVVFTDGYILGYFFQNSVATAFDPTNNSTYTIVYTASSSTMPPSDIGMCVAYNPNQTLVVGGFGNVAYIFSLTSTPPYQLDSLIQIPETTTRNIVVAANNIYLFTGIRGRIYIANGSQANEFAKVPDHLSGTIQPQFMWGAATTVNNKLCFGIYLSVSQSITSANTYGGIWMIDIDSGSIYVANELYGGYQAYCAALLPMSNLEYTGNGLIAGWRSHDSFGWGSSGIFQSADYPSSDSNSWITSDMIPIGTFLKRSSPVQVEYKLSTPMVSGESLEIQIGYYLDMTYASFISAGTFSYSADSSVNNISGNTQSFPVQNVNGYQGQQWLIVRAILKSTSVNPSYTRLTHLRISGATSKDNIPTMPFSLA